MTTKRQQTRSRTRQTARDTRLHVANTLSVAYLRERLHAAVLPMFTAMIDAAIGLRHIYEKDPATGQWARVTDPDAIAAVLNDPHHRVSEDRHIIYGQDPDARLLEGLLTFMAGAPFDPGLFPDLITSVTLDPATGEWTIHVNDAVLAAVRRPRPGARPRRAGLRAASRPIH